MAQSLKVYLDTVTSGLVPAVVDAVWINESGDITFDVTVTAARRNYQRGEKVPGCNPHWTIPRYAVRFTRSKSAPFPRIWAYNWRSLLNCQLPA